MLKARWPEGVVHLFGSTANCLAITNNNDIDVCLELPVLEDDQVREYTQVRQSARRKNVVVRQRGASIWRAARCSLLIKCKVCER